MSSNPRLLALQALAKKHLSTHHIPHFSNPSDRGLYIELVRGVLRHRSYLDFFITAVSDRPLHAINDYVLACLRLGIYQLLFLNTPAHAAVHETVELLEVAGPKKAKGFVNAGLRQFLRQRDQILPPENDLATRYSFPPALLAQFENCLHFAQRPREALEPLLRALNEPARICLRVNSQRTDRATLVQRFRDFDPTMDISETQSSPTGLYLSGHPDLRSLPGYDDGDFLVQSEASQGIAPLFENFNRGEKILDACAAPGGKTTHLVELSQPDTEIIALCAGKSAAASDVDEMGKKRLQENLRRLKMDQVKIIEGRAQQFATTHAQYEHYFDKILVDAPCTGLGTIAKNPERKWMFKPDDATVLAQEQTSILQSLWPLLKPGGTLVYSVCSLSLPEWTACEVLGGQSRQVFFWPDILGSEGLFAAVLKKP